MVRLSRWNVEFLANIAKIFTLQHVSLDVNLLRSLCLAFVILFSCLNNLDREIMFIQHFLAIHGVIEFAPKSFQFLHAKLEGFQATIDGLGGWCLYRCAHIILPCVMVLYQITTRQLYERVNKP